MGAVRWTWAALFRGALLTGALWGGVVRSARAADYAVELAPQPTRAEAESLLKGHEASGARVIRRYAHGTGWSYLVTVEGIADLDAARVVAGALAGPDQPCTVVERDGKQTRAVEIVTASEAEEGGQKDWGGASARKRRAPDDGTDAVIEAAVKAHGGRGAALERLGQATGLRFVFQRTIPADGGLLTARNVFIRQGESIRLEVSITAGTGKDSITAIGPSAAWVEADQTVVARDPGRTREVLDRFAPEAILAVPLGLPDDVATAEAWRNLHVVGTVTEDGHPRTVLAPAEEGKGGLVSASFDPEQHTLCRVTWRAEAGQMTFRYDDYRRVDKHLVLPFHARVERDGQLVEEVQVESVDLDLPPDASLFLAPKDSG